MDRYWTIARVELHLTDDEFAALDCRQFKLLHDRILHLRWQAQWQQGAIIAAVHNHAMTVKYDPPISPDQFVFTVRPGDKPKSLPTRPRMTKKRREAVTDGLRMLFQSLAQRTST